MRFFCAILLLSSLVLSVFANPIPSSPFDDGISLSSAYHRPTPITGNDVSPHHPDVELVRGDNSVSNVQVVHIFVIGPYDGSVYESIVQMMSYVTSRRVHVHVIIITDSFNRRADAQMLSDGLARVKSLCEGLEGSRVLALPTRVIIDEDSLAQLNNLEASGMNIVARARARHATFKYPQGVLRVAPPGKDETYNLNTASDLWVHTSPENWADAVLRVAGVMAEYSCDATKTAIKEAVMRLGQRRDRRGTAKFLVLKPIIPTKYRLLVTPVPWKIEVPSNPWISIVDIRRQSARHVQYNAHSNPDARIDNLPISQPRPPLVGFPGMKELLPDSPYRARVKALANEDLELDGPDRKRVKRQ